MMSSPMFLAVVGGGHNLGELKHGILKGSVGMHLLSCTDLVCRCRWFINGYISAIQISSHYRDLNCRNVVHSTVYICFLEGGRKFIILGDSYH